MTLPSHDDPYAAALPATLPVGGGGFDAEPLSWVLGEIRAALTLSGGALREALAARDDGRASALAHAAAYLHQAHGALQTLELQGVTRVTGDAERLLGHLADGTVWLDEALVARIELAFQALYEYLDELLAGAPQQPVRLFPYYRPLLEAMGAERIHPADLFDGDPLAFAETPFVAVEVEDALPMRQEFERTLLAYLKSGAAQDAARMAGLLGRIARSRAEGAAQRFWWVMQAFADGVAIGEVRGDTLVKQLFGRIAKQLRQLDEAGSQTALLKDALFYVAAAAHPSSLMQAVRSAWQVDGMVPPDYEQQRFGLIDQAALNTARERIAHARGLWARIVTGDLGVLTTFEQDLDALQGACALLNTPPLAQLAVRLAQVAGLVAAQVARAQHEEADCLDIATAILVLETALKDIRRLPDRFAARTDAMMADLDAIASGRRRSVRAEEDADLHGIPGGEDALAAQAEALRTLAAQMQAGLQEVEKILDDYFRVPAAVDALANVVPLLHQIEGGLAILEQDAAVLALQHTQIVVTRLAEGLAEPSSALFEELAQNLGALGLFMDALRLNPDEARRNFFFDAGENLFRARGKPTRAAGRGKAAATPAGAASAASAPLAVPTAGPAEPQSATAPGDDAGLSASTTGETGAAPPDAPLDAASADTSDEDATTGKRIGTQEVSPALYAIFRNESQDLLATLEAELAAWRAEPTRTVNVQALHALHSLAGSSATIGLAALQELAGALEALLQRLLRQPVTLAQQEFDVLGAVLAELRAMLAEAEAGRMPAAAPALLEGLERLEAGLDTHAAVSQLQAADDAAGDVAGDVAGYVAGYVAPSLDMDGLASAVAVEEGAVPQALLVDAFLTSRFETDVMSLQDAPDAELLPIFAEEARDLLPQIGRALRDWRRHPEAEDLPALLLRLAHTLKGSARMAGAMRLGQHMHHMEARVENCRHAQPVSAQMFDELLLHHDRSVQLFEQLLDASEAAQSVEAEVAPMAAPLPAGASAAANALLPAAANAPLVRVRADVLDRLVTQAGEVSIARSRMEDEFASLRASLGELGENLARLRHQLREVEVQADAQIGTQMAARHGAAARNFDPLEFDRYTRLQELTRMMAESVEDIGAVQQNVGSALSHAAADLAMQARMTRDLQQDLMRVRMVQFGSLADRLYRVVRQTAKDLGKRVNLDIRGGALEVDRGVLDRMVGAFEHLLRNAIVHGIEEEAGRRAAGKRETGDLVLEVRQDGNEVVLVFSDDGRGLDYAAIRARGIEAGLLDEDGVATEADLRDLVFTCGFSTAREVTENAGRGIGMDVVRAEAASLGGTVTLASAQGQGTRVTIRLPLTLAVTQLVLLGCGGQVYAIPSASIEQVVQLKKDAFALAYRDGAVQWQGQRVPMVYLGRLLAQRQASPAEQAYAPVLIVRHGPQRIAVHVDEVLGNREVVVKHTGPQIARLAGVAGATVLGSGQIVIIVDPMRLVGRELLPPPAEEAPARVHQASVLVVDDSLTVRRVTQRLLAREGYQVVTAKDGVEALERIRAGMPDLVLADIEMPRMDGFELIRALRADSRTAGLPVIVVTSRTATKHRATAESLGVQGYFGKPFQEGVLLDAIAAVLRRQQAA